jgi:hypothetical protein
MVAINELRSIVQLEDKTGLNEHRMIKLYDLLNFTLYWPCIVLQLKTYFTLPNYAQYLTIVSIYPYTYFCDPLRTAINKPKYVEG